MTLCTGVSDLHILVADESVRSLGVYAEAVVVNARTDSGADISVMMEPRVIERAYAVLVAEGMVTRLAGSP